MAEKKEKKKKRWPFAMAAVALAVAAILADSRWRLDVHDYEVVSARLPAGFDGFRIVVLSDLHGAEFGKDNRRLVEAVRDARPDLIALTGDIIVEKEDIPVAAALCAQLTPLAPCFFISGNHDAGSRGLTELREALEACGVKYLANEYLPLERNGDRIVLCGVEDPITWAVMPKPDEVVAALRREYPDDYVLFLGHRNDFADKYPLLDVDLIISGHNHGGVVRLPFVGGVLGNNGELFPEYDAGYYHTYCYDMVISRGLGQIKAIPRFLNPPDVPVITLKCK
jgi:predicted MPP superfamily phosphohydrolase